MAAEPQDLVPVEPTALAPTNLFGTSDPVAVIQHASGVAVALGQVIEKRHLYKDIQGRKHVLVEGWTLLGSMLGVFPETEWTRPVEGGWEARVVAKTLNGQVVGAAEAMCTRTERTWSQRDEYAIRSMAQTRAVSKALRLPLGFVMQLAGYQVTPAEEMEFAEPGSQPTPRERVRLGGPTRAAAPTQVSPPAPRAKVTNPIVIKPQKTEPAPDLPAAPSSEVIEGELVPPKRKPADLAVAYAEELARLSLMVEGRPRRVIEAAQNMLDKRAQESFGRHFGNLAPDEVETLVDRLSAAIKAKGGKVPGSE